MVINMKTRRGGGGGGGGLKRVTSFKSERKILKMLL